MTAYEASSLRAELQEPPALAARSAKTDALLVVGRWLAACGYAFTTVTPATHARIMARNGERIATSPRDVFGWSFPFHRNLLPSSVLAALENADAVDAAEGGLLRSCVRCSTLDELLFFHSAYPTLAADAVFFGPDTYRFARFIRNALPSLRSRPQCIVDVGCGSGAGGLLAGALLDDDNQLILADINIKALELARINAQLAGQAHVQCVHSDVLASVTGRIDLILANPPYLADASGRAYRDGGGHLGEGLTIRIVREALQRLSPGGHLLLYTASAIADGRDALRDALAALLNAAGAEFTYGEIDPDVFGEELETPAYAHIERIAVVGLVARQSGNAS